MTTSQQQLQLTGANSKGDRRELDFYPTPPECTVALSKALGIREKRIWEPACGSGAMSTVLEKCQNVVFSSDIGYYGYGQEGKDFLMFDPKMDFDVVMTNPPFNISEQFILRALQFAPMVCMLLKSQYWHAVKRLPLYLKNSPAHILPLTWRPDFLAHERAPGEKGSPTMEVQWTVWIEKDHSCRYTPLSKPKLPWY